MHLTLFCNCRSIVFFLITYDRSTEVKSTPKIKTAILHPDRNSHLQSRRWDKSRKLTNLVWKEFLVYLNDHSGHNGRVMWISSGGTQHHMPALPFPRMVTFAIWVVTTESWPSLRLRAWNRPPAAKGEADCFPGERASRSSLFASSPCAVPHRLSTVVTSRHVLLLWHWRNMAYWRRWRVRKKISFLRGEETEETAAATRRVTRLTVINPQMDIRSKFKLSPAKGTASDARRNKGASSRSFARVE